MRHEPVPMMVRGSPILDNTEDHRRVGEVLKAALSRPGACAKFVSAYFSIYGYGELRDGLEQLERFQFLFGDPRSVENVDPGENQPKEYRVGEDGKIEMKTMLTQKFLAAECQRWISQEKVSIRTIRKQNFLHGKMYHVKPSTPDVPETAIVGSSNFTKRGLGFAGNSNIEINVSMDADDANQLRDWFDEMWKSDLTENAKAEVLEELGRLGLDYPPEHVYYKTLLEIFRDELDARQDLDEQLGSSGLHDSRIWEMLFPFQRDAVPGIIRRLKKNNGCILADSVGLGKTFTALAVIKYFESRNERVLVLCPKRLRENWALYPARHNHSQNPLLADRFGYTLLSHTDLSRFRGKSGDIDLANFNWSNFDLVVIDESHNFRNSLEGKRDESNIWRLTRYGRLLGEVMKKGSNTKLLMLSATPVNISLTDLRNQIYLMTKHQTGTFQESLGIHDIQTMMANAQKQFVRWAKEQTAGNDGRDKNELMKMLGGEFFNLLDEVSIARSRRLIKKYYSSALEDIGGFPEREKPENLQPDTDTLGELSYENLCKQIEKLSFALYRPAHYLRPDSDAYLKLGEEKWNFDQREREESLSAMIQSNFLKRLESSPAALIATLTRIIEKYEDTIEKIRMLESRMEGSENSPDMPAAFEDEEDDDVIVGKGVHTYRLSDIQLAKWKKDLEGDRVALHATLSQIELVSPERDGKLREVTRLVKERLNSATESAGDCCAKKLLIFTAFKDTAEYLYSWIQPILTELGLHIAMVAGDGTRTTYGDNTYNAILTNFAPLGRGRYKRDGCGNIEKDGNPEISVLIATDCVSEGQNLQDCSVVVNYDIHWNPVRIIQRFGRIDRIGSPNPSVGMINFWPPVSLEEYLKLAMRINTRMALADMIATGDENPLKGNNQADTTKHQLELDLDFRDKQLRALRRSDSSMMEQDDGVDLSDFTLDEFYAQLLDFLRSWRSEIEKIPNGACAVVPSWGEKGSLLHKQEDAGAIFVLRHQGSGKNLKSNPRHPFYLSYVRENLVISLSFASLKQILRLFSDLTRGKSKPMQDMCDAFARRTGNGTQMELYSAMAESVATDIVKGSSLREEMRLTTDSHAVLPRKADRPNELSDFALVSWLVVLEKSSE